MQAKKILFPTDFSEHSEAALLQASSLARDSRAMLMIVHVKEPREPFTDTGFAGYPISSEDEAELTRRLNEVMPTDRNLGYVRRLLIGHPAEEIVQFAAEEGVDMIVMGTHGRTGLSRLLMGSVAESVVRQAKCPVLTVKQPLEANVVA